MIWLVTGAAGFIGSNLLEELLRADQAVVGLDNFVAGHRANLAAVQAAVTAEQWSRFRLVEGDIRDPETCRQACAGAGVVLHQAALGSVPASLNDPAGYHAVNATGTLNMLVAARDAGVRRFVYASSSAVYGDDERLPKLESQVGRPLSPYSASKAVNELHAAMFGRCYGMETVGLRYFNVFGPRQDPRGAYAAVIPAWIAAMLQGEPVYINGDGATSRDFCFVADVVQANLAAATTTRAEAVNQVYNVAAGRRTTLLELFGLLRQKLAPYRPGLEELQPQFRAARVADIRHSLADIGLARRLLGFAPKFDVERGLGAALSWYLAKQA